MAIRARARQDRSESSGVDARSGSTNDQPSPTVGRFDGPGRLSDTVQFAILPSQALDQRAVVGPGAGDALDQGRGTIPLTLAVDLLAEPAEQTVEIAPCEGVIEATQFGPGRS